MVASLQPTAVTTRRDVRCPVLRRALACAGEAAVSAVRTIEEPS